METFLAAFVLLGIVIFGLAIGVIFSNKPLKGSCGGLSAMTGDPCNFCGKKDECEEFNARQA